MVTKPPNIIQEGFSDKSRWDSKNETIFIITVLKPFTFVTEKFAELEKNLVHTQVRCFSGFNHKKEYMGGGGRGVLDIMIDIK